MSAASVSWESLELSERHRDELIASSISPDVATDRGYRTVDSGREIRRVGFSDSQCLPPAWLAPSFGIGGELENYVLKPDKPRIKDRVIKYEALPKHPSTL